MIDQSVLQSAEPNYVPYVLIVSMGLVVVAMAMVAMWACGARLPLPNSPDTRATALSRARSVNAKGDR
jgi:hypothetical protein